MTITVSSPRDTVRASLGDGTVLEGPCGTQVRDFFAARTYDSPVMAAVVDGRLRELTYELQEDVRLKPVLLSSSDGGRIYRRSLVLLLTTAVDELFPGTKVSVRYAVPQGAYYCTPRNRAAFTDDELDRLKAHMQKIVEADEPIIKRIVPLEEALEVFRARNADDKLRLLEQRDRDDLTVYRLRARTDYYYGYMEPSTGYLTLFHLECAGEGFLLQYPRSQHPREITTSPPDSKITQIFSEADEWLRLMGVEDMGHLNRIIRNGRVQEMMLIAEALHEQRIAYIAGEICARHKQDGMRIVLIAGPSSSGKTTFARRLAVQLLAHGVRPFTLEMDNYFVDRELTPRDENGEYDFEALGAMNISLFNQQLLQLIAGEPVRLPRFDFKQGKSVAGTKAMLDNNEIIILEGIHGLNPDLVPDIPPETVHRIYVSALTQLNVDAHNRVPTTDVRLLRRTIRDARSRGFTATQTLERWASVRRGEKRNIFPYQENADSIFNSALVYEVAALRPLVEPLLLQVMPDTPPHIEAKRLLSFLNWVEPLSPEPRALIPNTSLLREFIGGSVLEHYQPQTLEETKAE